MGSYKYTKFILLFLIIWLCASDGLKIKSKLNEDDNSQKTYSTTFYLTTEESNENERIMTNDVISSFPNDVKSICDTQRDSLYDRLNSPSTNYARITLYTNEDSLNKDDANLIQFNDSTMLELIKNKFRDMSDIFTYKECNIYVFNDAFYIVPNSKTGVTADRNRLFVDYLRLNKKTRDISDHFKIDSRLNVTEVENQYFLNSERDDIQTQNHYFTTTQESGYYTIQAARIIIDTIKVCSPNEESKSLISYQGNLNTDDGSSSVSLAENGYLLTVPAKADFVNSWIDKEYDKKHYNYEWEFYPSSNEMSAEYMINLLDQDISVNSKNSYVYGYNQYYEIDLIIPPPKGFASLAKFSYKKATVKTRDDKMVNTYFNMNIPDFSFLPLEITTESNNCNINYTDVNTVEISIIGLTKLSSVNYKSEFIKLATSKYYTITLYGIDGPLTFNSVSNDLIPSLKIGDINILTSDQNSLDKLAKFRITEENTMIEDPIIEINFYEYYVYRITGSIRYGEVANDWCSVKAELSNLDGEILSYFRFYFPPAYSTQLYSTFFNSQDGDSGFRSLLMNDFQIVSVNRDFNMDKMDALRHTNIIAYASSGVILKDGVTLFINAQLITDCIDYTFCRFIKKLEIPSNFNFTGFYVKDETRLESSMEDMKIGNEFYFKNNTLQIKVQMRTDSSYSYLKLKGDMIVAVDPNTDETFNGLWRFGEKNSDPISVTGRKYGVYQNVFEIPILDLTENNISVFLTVKEDNYNFDYTATSILGKNCYSRKDLIQYTEDSLDNYDTKIYSYTSSEENMDENRHINVVSNTCKTGLTDFYIKDHLDRNYYSSLYNFTSIDEMMRTIFTVMDEDNVEYLANSFTLNNGLNHTYSYEEAKKNEPMPFIGNTTFLGIDGETQILVYLQENYADLKFTLPSFTVGGGNVQFLTYEDFMKFYNIDKKHCHSGRFDHHIDCDDFVEKNTLTTSFPSDNLKSSVLLLDSNVVMFEILFRYSSNIEGRSFILPIVGKPYRGEFEADVRVEVEIVPDLQKETSSKSSIVLSQNGEYNHLKDSVNKNMQTWVKSIILADDMLKIKMAYFGEYQQNLQRIIASTTCEEEEICENFPKITCSRYSLQAVCIKTKNVCSIMTQQCTEEEKLCSRSDEDGNCFEYVSVCRQWENTCVDSTDVCIDFEEREIPDQCIKVELKCTKILKQSEHCLRSLEHFNKKLNEVNHDMELINEWIDLTHELVDSSVCSIKVTDPNERAKYTSCTNKQIATDPYDENVDILDLVRLKNTTSFMALREIISSDSIIFETDVQLYGDWVSKKSSDHLIGSSPAPRDEYPGDEYDVGRKSRVDIKHIIDFKNIDGTGSEISNRLEQTICKEFGITEEKSQRMQIILREFSDLNAYPQICKPYTEVKSPYIKSQDTEGKDQVSIYGTIDDEGTGLEKADTKMYTSKTKTGIEEITYVYNSDPKIVDETQIKHSYVNEIEGDDEELLGLDQRLISSVEEQKELSSLTNDELEEKEEKERKEAENQRNKEYDEAKDIQKQQEEQDKRNKDQADKETEKVNNENDARIDSIQQDKTNPQTASFQENNEVELNNQVQQNSEQEATFTEPTTVQASDSDVDESLPEISSSEELNEIENKDSASVSEPSVDSEETLVSEEIESESEQELSSNTFEATTDSNAYTVDNIDSESTTEANNEYSEQINSVVS